MRKLVWIINAAEVVKTVKTGKKLQGVIAWDDKQGMITIKANNPPGVKVKKTSLLCRMDFGRVTETGQFYNVIEHFPKVLGLDRIKKAFDRDAKDAKAAIVTNEIISRV